jgi:hypothetical protein
MPTSSTAYAARKASGLCVYHDRPARPGEVLCNACRDKQHAYRALNRTPEEQRAYLLRQRMRDSGLRVVPPAPAPAPAERFLLCCGAWWTITHIPLVVPCCGRRWLVENTP